MLSPRNIYSLIASNNAPYWKLFLIRDYKRNLVGSYSCENVAKDAEIAEKVQKSKEALSNMLANWEGETCPFEIDMRTSNTANGSSIFEGIRFKLDASESNEGNSGLSGIPNNPEALAGLGYVHRAQLESMLENVRNQSRLDIERERLAWQKEQFERELKEKQNELKELEKKYNSNSSLIQDGLTKALSGLISNFISIPGNESISGTEEKDEKNEAANDVAAYLYENFDMNEISKIKEVVKNVYTQKTTTRNKQEPAIENNRSEA